MSASISSTRSQALLNASKRRKPPKTRQISQKPIEATWAFGHGGGYPVYVEGAHAHDCAGRRAHVYAADGALTHVILGEGVRRARGVYEYTFRYDPTGPDKATREAHRKAREAYREARAVAPQTKAPVFLPWRKYLARCNKRNAGLDLVPLNREDEV